MNEFISELQENVTSGNLWESVVPIVGLIGALIIFGFGVWFVIQILPANKPTKGW